MTVKKLKIASWIFAAVGALCIGTALGIDDGIRNAKETV